MSPRTTFLSRLLGLYCLVAGLSMVSHKQATVDTIVALVHNAPLLFFIGIVTLVAGLAMVLTHNTWSGGALPVIVTLFGWLTLLKGLQFLLLPPDIAAGFYLGTLHYAQFFYFYAAFCLILGAYLTYAGFKSAPR
jgi:putative exporter of polyketide antibiotics